MRVLITRPVADYVVDPIKAAGHDVIMPAEDSPAAAAAAPTKPAAPAFTIPAKDSPPPPAPPPPPTKDSQGITPMLTGRIDGPFLDAPPALKAVSTPAVGYNNIDVPACTARGVG